MPMELRAIWQQAGWQTARRIPVTLIRLPVIWQPSGQPSAIRNIISTAAMVLQPRVRFLQIPRTWPDILQANALWPPAGQQHRQRRNAILTRAQVLCIQASGRLEAIHIISINQRSPKALWPPDGCPILPAEWNTILTRLPVLWLQEQRPLTECSTHSAVPEFFSPAAAIRIQQLLQVPGRSKISWPMPWNR